VSESEVRPHVADALLTRCGRALHRSDRLPDLFCTALRALPDRGIRPIKCRAAFYGGFVKSVEKFTTLGDIHVLCEKWMKLMGKLLDDGDCFLFNIHLF
jgi:hypothetical protein